MAMLPGPIEAIEAARTKNMMGTTPRLPRHTRTAWCASLSSVPFDCASVKSSVTPTSVRNSGVGNPAITVFTGIWPMYTPTIHAIAMARTPTFSVVTQLTRMATPSAMTEMTARFMRPYARWLTAHERVNELGGMKRPHAGEVFDLMAARDAARDEHRPGRQVSRSRQQRRSPMARETS